jgi:hypothetical protein
VERGELNSGLLVRIVSERFNRCLMAGNRNWTCEDEKRLLDLVASGVRRSVIAKTLQRIEAAVENRIHTLGKRADPALRRLIDDGIAS